jgi:hypothetical protein
MTEAQVRFVQLERKKDEIKKYYQDLAEATEALVKESGVGSYFMDDQGIVYGIIAPEGKFVPYEKYGYVRTKRPNEARGTLSIKEAQERGFPVK